MADGPTLISNPDTSTRRKMENSPYYVLASKMVSSLEVISYYLNIN